MAVGYACVGEMKWVLGTNECGLSDGDGEQQEEGLPLLLVNAGRIGGDELRFRAAGDGVCNQSITRSVLLDSSPLSSLSYTTLVKEDKREEYYHELAVLFVSLKRVRHEMLLYHHQFPVLHVLSMEKVDEIMHQK